MRIVTHNGKIHSDEVAAISLLNAYFANKNVDVYLLRTRDNDKIFPGDICVDVGLIYDHTSLKYDHHQEDFNEVWKEGDKILLSSAGLIWRHYGEEIVQMYLSKNMDLQYNDDILTEIKDLIYYKLIQEIDAYDNGMVINETKNEINELVSALNGNVNDDEEQNQNFDKAVSLVGNIFEIKFKEIINSYFNFQKDLEVVKQMNLSGPYLFVNKNIPTIFKCVSELDPECRVKYFIFEKKIESCETKGAGEYKGEYETKECVEYTVKPRRENGNKFSPIYPILSEELLRKSCDDIIFVHKAGLFAKVKTLESAKLVVNLSLLNMVEFNLEDTDYHIPEIPIEKIKKIADKKVMFGGLALFSLAGLGFLYWNSGDN